MNGAFDLAILGSGFAGSLLAMVARRLGLSVLLLERGTHPRFAIGESSSPLCNLLLEELGRRYDLPRLLPFTAYGPWKRAYPDVAVGLKRGFSFYQHRPGEPYTTDPERSRQLLVAASPNDEVADTHWYRADFDHFLVKEAQSLGAEYLDRVRIDRISRDADSTQLTGEREGRSVSFRARFVADATGPRGALAGLLNLPASTFPTMPPTQALFSHFTDVPLFAGGAEGDGETPPYPPDAAALHHVFAGGWMWVLRFDNGMTSAGFAVEDELAAEVGLAEGEPAWWRLLERFPSIGAQFQRAVPVRPFSHFPRLPYRCEQVVGPGWALLPSAAAFVDPLFSTGFPLTLLGIHRLAQMLEHGLDSHTRDDHLSAYAELTLREADAASRLVAGCYRTFQDFPAFGALSMLYFTAASYSEMARRLDRPHLATTFLLQNDPRFRDVFERHLAAAMQGRPSSPEQVARDLEPFNIAGLSNLAKRNWYGVDLNDVVRGAAKLDASPNEVTAFFQRMGWA